MIQCSDFQKSYNKKTIIDKSNFQIRDNKISFIMGKNGSGKTTLIKCIMGMEHYSGRVIFDEQDVDSIRNQCLVIWDDCPFYMNLNGVDNLEIFCESKMKRPDIIEFATDYMELDLLKSKVKSYSYGQKKKLALILAHILTPKYLIMDEISNGLDYESIKSLKQELVKMTESTTILLTGHQFDFYNGIIDDLFIFSDKKIILYKQDLKLSSERLEDIYDEKIH